MRRCTVAGSCHFYPRSPCGERRKIRIILILVRRFLSTLSLRRATRRSVKLFRQNYISIHALLAESDAPQQENGQAATISIHALLAESDQGYAGRPRSGWIFLSTLSLRRATVRYLPASPGGYYFYPRSPCGERRYPTLFDDLKVPISIHALLAESDKVSITIITICIA